MWTKKFNFPIHVQSRPSMTISGLIKTSTVAVGGSVVLRQTVLMQGFYHSWKICCVADEIGFIWISDTVDCWRKNVGLVKKCTQHLKYAAQQIDCIFRNACSQFTSRCAKVSSNIQHHKSMCRAYFLYSVKKPEEGYVTSCYENIRAANFRILPWIILHNTSSAGKDWHGWSAS